jgi:hypothetical protein
MLAVLHRIELAKLALMHLFEILHMKQDLALAVSSLMQSAQIIHGQIWVAPMHHDLLKRVQQLQSG